MFGIRNDIGILCVLIGLIMTSPTIYGETTNAPRVGEAPPDLKRLKLLQAPAGSEATWENLKGKVVVLEFWRTTCSPCRKAIPHINELIQEFKDKPVQFIAITDENPALVKQFLSQTPINGWIGIDEYEEIINAFAITGIPHTIIVNKKGKIAAITHPNQLQARHLDEILTGQPCSLPVVAKENSSTQNADRTEDLSAPLYEISIRPSLRDRSPGGATCMWSKEPDGCSIHGQIADVESALNNVFDIETSRQLLQTELPTGNYDFQLRVPPGHAEDLKVQFIQALKMTFGLDVHMVNKEMEVYTLSVATHIDNPPGLQKVTQTGGGGGFGGGFKLKGCPMHTIVGYLEDTLKTPVINETKLDGLFSVHMKWDMSKSELLLHRLPLRLWEILEASPTPNTLASLPKELTNGISDHDLELSLAEIQKPESKRFQPDPEAIVKAAQERLGLELRLVKRTIPVLEVRKAENHPLSSVE
jgi:uncharacterized protein (TIGR03435 family)